MPDHSPRLALPFIQPSQAQKHVTHNEALSTLDTVVQLAVEAVEASTPPAAPNEGEVWAIGLAPEGAWAGQAGRIATLIDDTWRFIAPQDGWIALDKSTGRLLRQAGGAWAPLAPPELVNLAGVGINAGFDAVNRLAVAAPATLLNHEGAGHQLKINKAAEGDTASLLFQTGFGGRAEMGTAGSDDFAIKVSADGGTWFTGLSLDAASGLVSGTAVQQTADDATAGRLLRVGAFGWGQDGAQAVPVLADLDTPGTASGVYAVTTATTGASGAGTCLILRGAAGEPAQILLDADGQRLAFRTRAGGVWGAWAALSGAHNITRDSGPDGSYVRYPDGTQICQHSLTLDAPDQVDGALFRAALPNGWSYPAAFAPGTRPTLTASATTQDGLWISAIAGDHLSGTLRAHAATPIATAPEITVTAIGRWM
ncbi:hypothetical protein ROTO_14770 [Roseovarius tolerans]|uniref:DUF2793 domain-containing protein n=1 Tax=Roseovarius tolerans TaxID=74031 RepID=A0A0L6CW66_9RHOB|nr:DUF2793 domain-containing protein [Roseovarius tolerans]KNX42009.1 hypothetical protein ROTO_14770 [Roseovarius tolerans]